MVPIPVNEPALETREAIPRGRTIWVFALAAVAVFLFLYRPALGVAAPLQPPSFAHILGTNDAGQDEFKALVIGTRTTLEVSLATAALASAFGTVLALVAGWWAVCEGVISGLASVWLALPRLPLLIILAALLKPTPESLVEVMTILAWPVVYRGLLPEVQRVRAHLWIILEKRQGVPDWVLMVRVLSLLRSAIVSQWLLEMRMAVWAEAGIGFLGLESSQIISLGTLLYYAVNSVNTLIGSAWLWTIVPVVMVMAGLSVGVTFPTLTRLDRQAVDQLAWKLL